MVSVLLKLARRYSIDIFQAITWNYSIALILTWLIYRPGLTNIESTHPALYLSLAILFPALFMIIGLTVKTAGIVRADVAQRLSLFISLAAAFLLFGETPTTLKIIGLAVGFIAILCSIPWQQQRGDKASGSAWLYLLIVFVGMGVIDVLLKQMSGVSFPAALFIIYAGAFVLSLLVLIVLVFAKKIKFTLRHIFFGWVLGIANFGNILFYLKAHQSLAGKPSTVFSAMNIGVIALGALIGLLIFKEKLSTLNKLGIVLAIAAIVIIAYTQTT